MTFILKVFLNPKSNLLHIHAKISRMYRKAAENPPPFCAYRVPEAAKYAVRDFCSDRIHKAERLKARRSRRCLFFLAAGKKYLIS